jgi:hypothetical protein
MSVSLRLSPNQAKYSHMILSTIEDKFDEVKDVTIPYARPEEA